MELQDTEIGGAFVHRTFSREGENVRGGTRMTAEEVLAIAPANRRALVSAGYIALYPRPPVESLSGPTNADGESVDTHIIHMGRGLYDVIRGVKLNTEPLTKEAAEELATRPPQLPPTN